jgi:hypothetical protein
MDFSTEKRTNVGHLGVGGEEVGPLGVSGVDVV